MISTVLEGATIVDGSGRPGFITDVAFTGERIALVGDCSQYEARRRLDCRGTVVAPGFIDACSHTGEKWLTAFSSQSKTNQGITTETTVLLQDSCRALWGESLPTTELFDLARRTEHETFGVFLAAQEVQAAVEGGAAGGDADLRERSREYALALAREAAAAGAPRIAVRLRDDGERALSAIDEAIGIAESANVHVHVNDLHVRYARGSGRMEQLLERIDRARTRGASITCDLAPYVATWIALASLLPAGVTPAALADDTLAAAVAMEMHARLGDVWHDLMLAEVGSEERMEWCGWRFDEIARATWRSPARTVVDFIRDEGERARAFYFCLSEDDVAMALSADFCAIGTSAASYRIDDAPFGLVHPRAFGTFPRVFGRFVRQRKTLSIEDAVRRMTSLPARIFGLQGHGTIVEGAPANVVVFDERAFVDTATYTQPFSLPVGLNHVFRDGVECRLAGGIS